MNTFTFYVESSAVTETFESVEAALVSSGYASYFQCDLGCCDQEDWWVSKETQVAVNAAIIKMRGQDELLKMRLNAHEVYASKITVSLLNKDYKTITAVYAEPKRFALAHSRYYMGEEELKSLIENVVRAYLSRVSTLERVRAKLMLPVRFHNF